MKTTIHTQLMKVSAALVLMTGGMLGGVQPFSQTPTVDAASVSTSQKHLQSQIYQALSARKSSVKLTYSGSVNELKKAIETALEAAIDQDPYTHYIMKGYAYSLAGRGTSSSAELNLTYRETAAQSAYVHKQVSAALRKITKPGMNDHLKVKAIHDWVVRTLKYDTTLSKFTAYEGLKTGSTVCQGYALLTYDMLKQAGFETNIVEGYVKGEAHAWNMVKLDGKWYQLDTTWDDPVPDLGDHGVTTYYLVSDQQLRQDHTWKTANYPQAITSYAQTLDGLVANGVKGAKELRTALGYSSGSGSYVSNSDGLRRIVKAADQKGEDRLTFQYKGTKSKLKQDLLSLYDYGLSPTGYTSQALSGSNKWKVTLYWK
ncbi:hypothetical protein B9G55_23350 [Saccharibacillus sp. O16]|nr:hypothetical protein B9G55_23350 [Saccharibacillus sp. O16]